MSERTPEQAAQFLDSLMVEAEHLESAELLALGHEALDLVLLRTKRGLDVDGRPFHPYTPEYRLQRIEAGYSGTPDLVRKGHMLGAAIVKQNSADEVSVEIVDRLQAKKAAAHNEGVNRDVPVRAHENVQHRSTTGRLISESAARLEKGSYTKRFTRLKSVRHMNLPKREFLDVRLDAEVQLLAEGAGEKIALRIEKKLER